MEKEKRKSIRKKSPLTYAVEDKYQVFIRNYINKTKNETGLSKRRIVTDLILESINRKKNILP